MKILYWGMGGIFSSIPLRYLLAGGWRVAGVVVPARRATAVAIQPLSPGPTLPGEHSIIELAWRQNIPVFAVRQAGAAETIAQLAALQPDVACVACFPYRLSAALLALPRSGFFNLHPSLLPAYRGPEPLFWQWQRGEPQTGVTIHQMDEGLDTGPIGAQTAVPLPDGIGRLRADQLLAEAGSEQLGKVLTQLAQGKLPLRPQPPGGSQFGRPGTADFVLDINDSARRAFNFMRGTADWKRPYRLDVAGETVWLQTALGYTPDGVLPQPVVAAAEGLHIQFAPGVLIAARSPRHLSSVGDFKA